MDEVAGAKKDGFIYEWFLVRREGLETWKAEHEAHGAEIVYMDLDDAIVYIQSIDFQ